jgi:hypothetical protein
MAWTSQGLFSSINRVGGRLSSTGMAAPQNHQGPGILVYSISIHGGGPGTLSSRWRSEPLLLIFQTAGSRIGRRTPSLVFKEIFWNSTLYLNLIGQP